VHVLEAQDEAFAIMRAVQSDLIDRLQGALSLAAQATRASSNGFTAYNTADGQTSIALQVLVCLHLSCMLLRAADSPLTGSGALAAQVGTGQQVQWFVASATALVRRCRQITC
jgi:hypothetical protein